MNRERPHHPFQLAIEQAWDAGHTPRLLVLGDRPGVKLPHDVIERYDGAPVPLDFKPEDPLNPTFNAEGCALDLAFHGTVMRCVIPWNTIIAVTNLMTGHGFVRLVPNGRASTAGAGSKMERAGATAPAHVGPAVMGTKPSHLRGIDGGKKP